MVVQASDPNAERPRQEDGEFKASPRGLGDASVGNNTFAPHT